MPSATPQIMREQRLSRQHNNRLLSQIRRDARLAERLTGEISAATEAVNNCDARNAQFVGQGAESVGRHLLALAAVPAAYLVDYFLLAPSIEFLVGGSDAEAGWTVSFAQAVTPAALLLIEAGIASRRALAEDEAAAYGQRGALWFWTGLGLLPPTIAATLAVATQLAKAQQEGLPQTLIFLALPAALGALAFLLHAFILLNSRLLHEAKAYAIFRAERAARQRKAARVTRAREQTIDDLSNALTEYLQRLQAYNTNFPDAPMEPGPFDAMARREVNRLMGYEFIQDPEANRGNAAAPASSQDPTVNQHAQSTEAQTSVPQTPAEARPANSSGEEEYLRTILTRTVRERDSEVQP